MLVDESIGLESEVSVTTKCKDRLANILDALLQNRTLLTAVDEPEELVTVCELLRTLQAYHPALASTRSLFLIRLAMEVKVSYIDFPGNSRIVKSNLTY